MPRSRTIGQKVETLIQIECGSLELACGAHQLLVDAIGLRPVRLPSGPFSLAAAAGLSSLVWGPPMPLVGVLFTATALFVSRIATLGFANGAPLRIFDICHKYHFNLPKYSRQTTL
jgi:hypothetical protein